MRLFRILHMLFPVPYFPFSYSYQSGCCPHLLLKMLILIHQQLGLAKSEAFKSSSQVHFTKLSMSSSLRNQYSTGFCSGTVLLPLKLLFLRNLYG